MTKDRIFLFEFVDGQPFDGFMRWIDTAVPYSGRRLWTPDVSKRIAFFPNPIPDERKEWHEDLMKRAEESTPPKRVGNRSPSVDS